MGNWKRAIAIDFDGTLCENNYPDIGEPNWNVIYEAIQELFEDLGGVTLELLIDNPTALVIENNPRNETEIRYNPHALLMARHLGTELNACPCYWPRKKGKIERPFNYIEEQFIKGNHFASMEDLNRRILSKGSEHLISK